ncbi:hypothetical protein [Nostoc commune]|nr:hypothetical protein [Nostoc commune]
MMNYLDYHSQMCQRILQAMAYSPAGGDRFCQEMLLPTATIGDQKLSQA